MNIIYTYIHTIHIYIYINTFDYSNGYCNHEIQVTINELMIDTNKQNNNKCFTHSLRGQFATHNFACIYLREDRRKSRGRIVNRQLCRQPGARIDRVEKRLANFRLMTSGKHSRCFFVVIVCPTLGLFAVFLVMPLGKGILVG